jgi:hypothetical protein
VKDLGPRIISIGVANDREISGWRIGIPGDEEKRSYTLSELAWIAEHAPERIPDGGIRYGKIPGPAYASRAVVTWHQI